MHRKIGHTGAHVLAAAIAWLASTGLAGAQAKPEQKQPMSEQVFKNVTVLKKIPANEFMATMGFFSASLGMTCTDCHALQSAGSWEKYADDTELKQTARKMLVMVSAINKTYFAGRREITCYSCHRGGERPRLTPSLAEMYGPPPVEEPDELREAAARATAPDNVLDKYIQAIGGLQQLAKLNGFSAKGTYKGFSDLDKHPFEVFAQAPGHLTTINHALTGDTTTATDGRTAWQAAPATDSPVQVLELTGGDLDGAKLEATLLLPAGIKQALTQWRAGNPITIDNREVQLIQGTSDGRYPVNLYFDSKSGLLTRMVRYTDSPVGLSPTQIDYSDYREVAGVKIPHRWTVTWLDGRASIELDAVQPNATIDPAKFGKPAAPAAPAAR